MCEKKAVGHNTRNSRKLELVDLRTNSGLIRSMTRDNSNSVSLSLPLDDRVLGWYEGELALGKVINGLGSGPADRRRGVVSLLLLVDRQVLHVERVADPINAEIGHGRFPDSSAVAGVCQDVVGILCCLDSCGRDELGRNDSHCE